MIDQLPPQNLEAERGVIASILTPGNDVIDDVMSFLRAEDFYRDRHAVMFETIREMYHARRRIDAVLLDEELRRRERYHEIGGFEGLAEIFDSVAHSANGLHYGQVVKQKAIARRLIEASNRNLREAYSGQFTAEDLLAAAEKRVLAIRDAETTSRAVHIGDLAPDAILRFNRRVDRECVGLPTGYADLDSLLCGLRPGNLIYVGARPSMGKTSFATSLVDDVAVKRNRPVLFVSLEMSREEMIDRFAVTNSGVCSLDAQRGKLSDEDAEKYRRAVERVAESPIYLDGGGSMSAVQILASARRARSQHGVELLVVDYMQRVSDPDERDPRRRINEASKLFKDAAGELGIPVVVLTQVRRLPDGRDAERPRLSDLKESGNQEEDADVVILLHRPEYYDPADQPGVAVCDVAKNRHGPKGDVSLRFLRRSMRFESHYPEEAPADDDRPF